MDDTKSKFYNYQIIKAVTCTIYESFRTGIGDVSVAFEDIIDFFSFVCYFFRFTFYPIIFKKKKRLKISFNYLNSSL